MFSIPIDSPHSTRPTTTKRMARIYEHDHRSKSMTALPESTAILLQSRQTQRGKPSSCRSPATPSPGLPSLHSASSSSTSPTIYSPLTPDVDSAYFSPRLAPSHGLPTYAPSRPAHSQAAIKDSPTTRATNCWRATVCSSKDEQFRPPVPPLAHRSRSDPAASEPKLERRKCMYNVDKQLTLAQKILFDASPEGRQQGPLLPPIHTEDLNNIFMDGPTSLTPSSTYSSSLYTSELDHQFPMPPATTPDVSGYTDSPMFSEAETCEVREFLRKRWGSVDAGDNIQTEKLLLSSIPGSVGSYAEDTELWDDRWPRDIPQDFSWEMEEGKVNAENRDLLEQLGLLEDKKSERTGFLAEHPLSTSSPPRRVRTDDVSATLTALRSSPQSLNPSQESGDSGDRDNALREELRTRLRSQRSTEFMRPRASNIRRPASTNFSPLRNISFDHKPLPPPPCPPVPANHRPIATLHTPSSSGEYGEARISVQLAAAPSEHSVALERLENSLSRLQAHSPASTPTKAQVPPRSPGILKKPKTLPLDVAAHYADPRPVARANTSVHQKHERQQHSRSPSAPECAVRRPALRVPADPFRASRGAGPDVFDGVPPADAEGMRSFMNITPEPRDLSLPAHGPLMAYRSRTSTAEVTVGPAEKARKLLARASVSIVNWGRSLSRTRSGRKSRA
ncbi:hypothetical protein FIBSPDRAFT_956725 [Athelia psychrophila]|uniref:Uncharacterized protein n=1 Tax=Athelia psychrophila TaxID=1759441 RepID=A0A166GMB3_9AGAM|nr:hypothetical protein FIBSPDRAFT_956725 [Fibularhizoctonia sp. CBS 109695]